MQLERGSLRRVIPVLIFDISLPYHFAGDRLLSGTHVLPGGSDRHPALIHTLKNFTI